MLRKYFVLLLMLFCFIESVSEKKYINIAQGVTTQDLFTPNAHLPVVVKQEHFSKESKKSRKTVFKHVSDLTATFTDIPLCVDAYEKQLKALSPETRYEFLSNQSIESLQQLYLTELARLGWNIEVISVLKEVVLLGIKPYKKVLILLNKTEGGWFSKAASQVIIIIKEQ